MPINLAATSLVERNYKIKEMNFGFNCFKKPTTAYIGDSS